VRLFSKFVLRHALSIGLLGTALGGLGGYYTIQLYQNLRTEIHELLPTQARSVIDLQEVSHRLESIEHLAVLVFSDYPQHSKRFVNDLVKKLEKTPRSTIASIDYKIDRELLFFKQRQALFMELEDLKKIHTYLTKRIAYERELYNPLTIFSNQEIPEPQLDFMVLKKKYEGRTKTYENFPEGYYATSDGKKRVVLINLPGKAGGIENSLRLKKTVQTAIEQLKPQTYSSDLQVHFTGAVEDTIEEQEALVEDLVWSTLIVIVLVSAGMLLFYKNIRATIALILSLFVGTLWTFGVSFFWVGYLNANSAFLGSIIIGNGINFGIIYLARYLEERRKRHTHSRATYTAMTKTATSTWTAASAAGLSYGSLMLTSFRGFNQFGMIGLFGMILCWLSAYTLLPCYLTLFERIRPLVQAHATTSVGFLSHMLAKTVSTFPRTIWRLAFFVSLICALNLPRFNSRILETNLSRLRNKASLEHGSAYLSQYLDTIFQHYLSPLVILPHLPGNTEKIAHALKEEKRLHENTLLGSIQTIQDFVPTQQEEKIRILKSIAKQLPPSLRKQLSTEDRKLLREFLPPEVLKPFGIKDLPPLVLQKFTEKNHSVGKMILVEPPLSRQEDLHNASKLNSFINKLRQTADSVEANTPIAGTLAITSDMTQHITHDGPRATLFAFLAVVFLVIVLFRNVKTIALILFSLFLGVLWLAGIIIGCNLKINFLNFIALPITFGIGVDYGVNIFQRYRESHKKNQAADILKVLQHTGGAVGLSSFCTMVGYLSLLIAGNQGFVSFGLLAILGELTCVLAATLVLPAYLVKRRDSTK